MINSKFVNITLAVPKELAGRIISENGMEGVFRGQDAKFQYMVKCSLAKKPFPEKLIPWVKDVLLSNSASMNEVRNGMHALRKDMNILGKSANQILTLQQQLGSMAKVNTGIELANHFDLKAVKSGVKAIADQVGNVAAMQQNLMNASHLNTAVELANNYELKVLKHDVRAMAFQVDTIFEMQQDLLSISYLNTGLSLANLALNAAGFAMLSQKLSALHNDIQRISKLAEQQYALSKNEKLADCQRLIMQSNMILAKVKEHSPLDLDELQKHLIELRSFISEICKDLCDGALDVELVMSMVHTLLPAYTLILKDFISRYYDEKHSIPTNYDIFMSLYEELNDEVLLEKIKEHHFLKKEMHIQQVQDVLNAHVLINFNGQLQVNDEVCLLQELGSRADLLLLEESLERIAKKRLEDAIPVLAQKAGISEKECAAYFSMD